MTRAAFNRWRYGVLGIALAGGLACRESASTQLAPPSTTIAVRLARVEHAARALPVRGTGLIAPKQEARMSFKVGGLIRSITVDEGAIFARRQVLASLITTEIDAGVEQARQAVIKAERDRDRIEQLVAGRAATGTQLDDARTLVEVARARLRAAEFDRAHAVIRAPHAGRVLRRLAEPGELVSAGQPVLVVAGDRDGWVLRVGLAERDVVRVREGDPAKLVFSAWPDAAPVRATVSEIASAATPPLGVFEVELRVEAAGRPLRAGLVAHATIEPQDREQVALIPALALRDGDRRNASVWVPMPDKRVERRRVEIAFFDGDRVAIRRGLEGVVSVVTDGAAYLTDTSRIDVTP